MSCLEDQRETEIPQIFEKAPQKLQLSIQAFPAQPGPHVALDAKSGQNPEQAAVSLQTCVQICCDADGEALQIMPQRYPHRDLADLGDNIVSGFSDRDYKQRLFDDRFVDASEAHSNLTVERERVVHISYWLARMPLVVENVIVGVWRLAPGCPLRPV